MIATCIRVALVSGVMALSVPAFAFGDAEEKLVTNAYVNMTMAEVYDRECNNGKVTGNVKDKGHTANFAASKQKITDELSKRLSQSTQGDVTPILSRIAESTTEYATKSFRGINGCRNGDARHAEKMLDIMRKTEPDFLMRKLGEAVVEKAADEADGQ